VRWAPEKTNWACVDEPAGPDADAFARLTVLFERAWYGERRVDEAAYARIAAAFDGFAPQRLAAA